MCYSRFFIRALKLPAFNTSVELITAGTLGKFIFIYIYTISITPLNWYLYLLNWWLYSSLGGRGALTPEQRASKAVFSYFSNASLFPSCQWCHNTSDEWLWHCTSSVLVPEAGKQKVPIRDRTTNQHRDCLMESSACCDIGPPFEVLSVPPHLPGSQISISDESEDKPAAFLHLSFCCRGLKTFHCRVCALSEVITD